MFFGGLIAAFTAFFSDLWAWIASFFGGNLPIVAMTGMILTASALGCTSPGAMTPEQFAQTQSMIEQVRGLAESSGSAYSIDITFDGRPSVGATQDFYLNTGATVRAHLHGNFKGADSADLGPVQ